MLFKPSFLYLHRKMNWYYFIFFLTYHISGMFNFYHDSMYEEPERSVKLIKKYYKGLGRVMFNTGIISSLTFKILEYMITPYTDVFIRKIEIIKFIIALGILDILRYLTHRLFHSTYLYDKYHSQNHIYINSVGWLSSYTHPVDWIVRSLLVCAIPVWITNMHIYSVYFWIFVMTHSAVRFDTFRKYHYMFPKNNYSINLFMDRIFGTYY
jgi:sterol desaturase/sphingolipid hydroxylase (fatty acid hydroxylase superfamily)